MLTSIIGFIIYVVSAYLLAQVLMSLIASIAPSWSDSSVKWASYIGGVVLVVALSPIINSWVVAPLSNLLSGSN